MDLSILDWFIVIVGMLVLVVLLDGYRRAQRARRNQVRLSKNAKRLSKASAAENKFTAELPNGGARVVLNNHQVDEPVTSGLSAQDNFTVGASVDVGNIDESVEPSVTDDEGAAQAEAETFTETEEIDPLFVDPFKAAAAEVKPVTPDVTTPKNTDEPLLTESKSTEREEFQPCLFEKQDAADNKKEQNPVEEVIVLNVLSSKPEGFSGEDLLHILLACDCRFGEMNIFHRYEQANEGGPVQFSIVNMVKPGIFDLQNINEFSTPGVSFFVQLPGPENAIQAFDAMVETAKILARNLNGELKDETHSAVTEQTIDHCRERIRNYQKKCLVNA